MPADEVTRDAGRADELAREGESIAKQGRAVTPDRREESERAERQQAELAETLDERGSEKGPMYSGIGQVPPERKEPEVEQVSTEIDRDRRR